MLLRQVQIYGAEYICTCCMFVPVCGYSLYFYWEQLYDWKLPLCLSFLWILQWGSLLYCTSAPQYIAYFSRNIQEYAVNGLAMNTLEEIELPQASPVWSNQDNLKNMATFHLLGIPILGCEQFVHTWRWLHSYRWASPSRSSSRGSCFLRTLPPCS